MSVFKRPGAETYSYNFQLPGPSIFWQYRSP